jgi:hypothetical protein
MRNTSHVRVENKRHNFAIFFLKTAHLVAGGKQEED